MFTFRNWPKFKKRDIKFSIRDPLNPYNDLVLNSFDYKKMKVMAEYGLLDTELTQEILEEKPLPTTHIHEQWPR